MESFFTLTSNEIDAIKLSLLVGFTSVIFSLPFGIFFGYILARFDFFGKSVLDSLLHLPLVMPPVVMGYILLLLFGRNGFIGASLEKYLGISFAFNWKGAALAAAVVSFPLMVRAIRMAIEYVDTGYEDAAATLGANPIRVFFTITIPLAVNGIIAGVITAFARSLGEFGATITFVSNIPGETATIPIELYSLIQSPNISYATFRLAGISILIAFFSLILSDYLAHRSKKIGSRNK